MHLRLLGVFSVEYIWICIFEVLCGYIVKIKISDG
jgi:hypothetical protein